MYCRCGIAWIIDTTRVVCGRVCVTVRCLLHAAAAGLLLWARLAGDVDRSGQLPTSQQHGIQQ